MNFIGVACVKNEADIIETFVRHNLAFLDRLIVVDHGSTDDTPNILRSLQKEGLSLDVTRDDSLGILQGEKMTSLMRRAAEAGAEWVVLLDGDELIKTHAQNLPLPPKSGPGVLKVAWNTYCARPDDDASETNPALRIRHRLASEPYEKESLHDRRFQLKSIVRRDVALHPETFVLQGNHQVLQAGTELDHTFWNGWSLAHYSLRSPGQYASKIAIEVLQHLAHGSMMAPINSFNVSHLEQVRKSLDAFADTFYNHLPVYIEITRHPLDKVVDPLPYRGSPLQYTSQFSDLALLVSNLLGYSESLARALSHRPPKKDPTFEVTSHLTLRSLNDPSQIICSTPCQLQAFRPDIVVLPLDGWDGEDDLILEIGGPVAYVECLSLCFKRPDGSSLELTGTDLRNSLKIRSKAHFVYHESYTAFVKGLCSAELRMQSHPSGLTGKWKEVEISLRIDSDPAIVGLRYFQQDPFQEARNLLLLVGKLEQKVSQLVTVRGFLRHQFNWIMGCIFSKK